MEVRKFTSNLFHVLIVVLWFHLVELYVHVGLTPRLGFLHDRGEAEPTTEVCRLRYIQTV